MNFYPLKAVVTTNQTLTSLYEGDPYSTFLTSGCLSPRELTVLLDQGASFDALIFINGEGQDILDRPEGQKLGANTKVIRHEMFTLDQLDTPGAVKRIHDLLKAEYNLFDIGG